MKASDKIQYDRYLKGETLPHFRTLSGIEMKEFYQRDDRPHEEPPPGVFPFTRGIHPDMYRSRLWTRRQQSGFGTPEESNQRIHLLLSKGMTGLNIDFDVVTKLGLDPDHPLAEGNVGLVGTSVATLEDMETLFHGIPLDKVSTTLIVNPPYSAIIMAMYLLVARKQNVEASGLIGTIMNCAISQLVGPTYQSGTHFFPLDPTLKIAGDVMEYCIKNIPRWNILNINAYNMRETGINAAQEIAFSFSLVSEYIRHLLARGMEIDQLGPRIAFFTSAHIDFLEEIAKLRAMRRIWAHLMKDTFHAKNERSCWFRTAIQTSSLPLTAQQPLNNIVRAAIQTLAAVLGGSQSIHTTSYDEAYALPTEESHILSIRTQQVIAYETGVCRSADPLGGSYAIEKLTDEIEERALALMEEIEKRGGFFECFKSQWIEKQINEARYEYARQLEAGEQIQVGVNMERDEDEEVKINIFRQASDMQEKRIRYLREYKESRNGDQVKRALENLYHQVKHHPNSNFFQTILEAVDQKATLGEISDTLREAYDFKVHSD
ncbi:MAG: methylmalonyl-CoA mutase family protein [Thermodesulfobacteriota bacterium]|nr:methylmalonyl-CoA mutase family protein [Thermodesulfobacteriota bacterium]